jgi:hypothetical protein
MLLLQRFVGGGNPDPITAHGQTYTAQLGGSVRLDVWGTEAVCPGAVDLDQCCEAHARYGDRR